MYLQIAYLVGSPATYGLPTSLLVAQISPITFQTKFRSHLVLALDQVSVSKIEFFFDLMNLKIVCVNSLDTMITWFIVPQIKSLVRLKRSSKLAYIKRCHVSY